MFGGKFIGLEFYWTPSLCGEFMVILPQFPYSLGKFTFPNMHVLLMVMEGSF